MAEIVSRLKGNFLGPKADAEYELVNGQIWRQTRDYRRFDYAYQPKVTIRPEAGGHMMYVAGFPTGIPVRQLR
jgi:hypothetical protein